jgi:Domain of unknown function (DUF1839)
MQRLVPLDPATYRRHSLHTDPRAWPETNCYSDVLIELLHALGREPIAGLAFTLAIDFEGDQWTFFKFPHADLLELYGFDIQELAVWRTLTDHIADLVAAGRPVLVELDSYFLPDTVGSVYRRAHVKSTVAVNEIDPAAGRLGYFHNQGYYTLEGADFSEIFQVGGLVNDRMLPPYFEYVKIRSDYVAPSAQVLLERSLVTLNRHLSRAPTDNPFARFRTGFRKDLDWLMSSGLETFHAYSFATLRQYGACYELSETYLRWLSGQGVEGLTEAAAAFQSIAQGAKAFQFNLARSMARKRPLDLSPLEAMADQWGQGMSLLRRRFT